MKRHELINRLTKYIGSGKSNIIQCYEGYPNKEFLFNDLKNKLHELFPNHHIITIEPIIKYKNNLLPLLSSLKEISNDNPTIVLIHDLFYYSAPEAIINSFYNCSSLTGFITSNVNVSYKLKRKDTLVRGRYNTFFLPPFLYGDEEDITVQPINYLTDDINKIYTYILAHAGQMLTYRNIYKNIDTTMTLTSLIEIVEYLVNYNILYRLPRIDINKMNELTCGYIYYPVNIRDIDNSSLSYEEKYKLKREAFFVSKMIYDGLKVKKAISYQYVTKDSKRVRIEVNRGFLISNYDKYVVVKLIFENSDEEIERLIKSQRNIPHIVALLGNMEYTMDKYGLTYVGLDNLLTKGLEGYGGI